MHLKDILRQIETDRDNLRHYRSPLWIIADPLRPLNAVGGRLQHQRHIEIKMRNFLKNIMLFAKIVPNDVKPVKEERNVEPYVPDSKIGTVKVSDGVIESAVSEPPLLDILPASIVPPYYGPVLDRIVKNARGRRNKKIADTSTYNVVATEFDHEFYTLHYQDMSRALRLDFVNHYVEFGHKEKRDPTSNFSTRLYLQRYPDVAKAEINPFRHWIEAGRAEGRIAAPYDRFEEVAALTDLSAVEAQTQLTETRDAVRCRLRSGVLGEMVVCAAALEPMISATWPEMVRIKVPPFHTADTAARVAALHAMQSAAEFGRARYVILVNRPRWGVNRRMEGHIGHALAALNCSPEDIVVVTTEESGEMPSGKFPEGVRYVPFAAISTGLKEDVRQRLLVEFLRSLRPEAVFNINSRTMWDAMGFYGKALSSSMRLIVGLFCSEQSAIGYWNGYPIKRFYRNFDILDAVCVDSHALRRELIARYNIPEADRNRIVVLEGPVDPSIPVAPAPPPDPDRQRQIIWSGRFDRQKRIDILYGIAALMPSVAFHVWGQEVLNSTPLPPALPNVLIHPPYTDFKGLPLEQFDLWLYTAEWDGVPSILLEVAMTGLPLIGSLTGGTGEVLRSDMSEPVSDVDDVDVYVAAIRRVLGDPESARHRALALRTALAVERTETAYSERVAKALSCEAPESAKRREKLCSPDASTVPPDAIPARITSEEVDLSLILTVHDETFVSGPTMTSADIAVQRAREAGFSVEQVIAFDKAHPRTIDYFGQPAFDHWHRIMLAQGDLGRVRNEVLKMTSGRQIAFLDADDLFSENWLVAAMKRAVRAEAEGTHVIVHPELNWQFDEGSSILFNTAQDHPLFTPEYLATMHYYDSLCLAPRMAHEAVPYVSRDILNGLSFQDWQFTIETMDRGWQHVVAEDTIIFKRRRENSLVVESSARKSVLRPLDCMAIDRITRLGAGNRTLLPES